MREWLDRMLQIIRANKLISVLSCLGSIALLIGSLSMGAQSPEQRLQFTQASANKEPKLLPSGTSLIKSKSGKEVVVDVAGAVKKPGVYVLHDSVRVKDAILAAGGFADSVDKLRVAQTINLAALLTDGAKLYIPSLGEHLMTSAGGSTNSSATVLGSATQLVNINQGSSSDLDGLPGVGKVTADKIIANRPYGSVQELVDKKVIGASLLGKIKDKITLY